MRLPYAALTLLILSASAAFGQGYARHNVELGIGAAVPRGDLKPFFEPAPSLQVGYGYRFSRYFQADGGFEAVFSAGDVEDYLETNFGPLRIRDYAFFVPIGGRAILPLFGERLHIYGGGGAAYTRYSELVRQPSEFIRIDCPPCASRSGWGSYAQAGFSVGIDRRGLFRLGVRARMYRATTSGDPFAGIPAVDTNDRWSNVTAVFSVTF
ncbi:MAG: outer membrane beta-barrel protein [Bryobacteraceae bacterium]|nr:outer membrane beta-barrel protein [Bryobacteraceae bacterium]